MKDDGNVIMTVSPNTWQYLRWQSKQKTNRNKVICIVVHVEDKDNIMTTMMVMVMVKMVMMVMVKMMRMA